MTKKRDKEAALSFMKKALKRHGWYCQSKCTAFSQSGYHNCAKHDNARLIAI